MIAELVARHLLLAVLPLVAGAVVAVLLRLARRALPAAGTAVDRIVAVGGALPVVAVWVILPIITGQPLMRTAHLEIALSLLVLSLVYPPLAAVPAADAGRRAVRAAGLPVWQRGWWSLRRWLPALSRGLAPAWVATVLGVTLAALLHDRAAHGVGRVLVEGWRTDDQFTVALGAVLVVVIAAVGDGLIRLLGRVVGVRVVEVR